MIHRPFYKKIPGLCEVSISTALYYAAIMIGMGLLLYIHFRLNINDLHVPLTYQGDSLWNLFYVKTLMENGSYWENPALGAPFIGKYYDFPHNFLLEIWIIRFLGLFFHEAGLVHNLYYFLGFILTAWSAFWVLCRLGIVRPLALAGAVVFSLLPYHFMRIEHLSLSNYCTVPLAAWLALELGATAPSYEDENRWISSIRHLIVVIITGIGPAYYVFFGFAVTSFGGIIGFISTRKPERIVRAFILASTMLVVFMVSNAPSSIFKWENGKNAEAVNRLSSESEIYGLRITQLLLPEFEHHFKPFAIFAEKYQKEAPLITENRTAYLGAIGSLGFLLLVGSVLIGLRTREVPYLHQLSLLVLFALLLGTIGGLGAVFAWLITPSVRAWNRLSVFIAFFSIAGLLLSVQWLIDKLDDWKQFVSVTLSMAIICYGFWDQVPLYSQQQYHDASQNFFNDRSFVQGIEALLPKGTKIFQAPHIPFPEQSQLFQEGTYGLMRGYLHSVGLKWSYGAFKGREENSWLAAVNSLPPDRNIKILKDAGFGAIWVERRAYSDHAVSFESKIAAILGQPLLVSKDKHIAVYRIKHRKILWTPLYLKNNLEKS